MILVLFITLILNSDFILGRMFSDSRDRDYNGYHQINSFGFHIDIPQYIIELSDYINNESDFYKILLLPDFSSSLYNWGYGGASDILISLIEDKGLIYRSYGEGMVPPNSVEGIQNILIDLIFENPTSPVLNKLFSILNIRYIILRNDFKEIFSGKIKSIEKNKYSLESIPGIKLKKTFGLWDIYEVNNSLKINSLYTPNLIYPVSIQGSSKYTSLDYLIKFYEILDSNIITKDTLPFFYMSSDENISKHILNNNNSELSFIRNSPTLVNIKIKTSNKIFPLVLSDNYDKSWKLAVYSSTGNIYFDYLNLLNYELLQLGKINKNNFSNQYLVNGYANGWLIDIEKLCKLYNCLADNDAFIKELAIYNKSQLIFIFGSILSLLTLLTTIILFIIAKIKK